MEQRLVPWRGMTGNGACIYHESGSSFLKMMPARFAQVYLPTFQKGKIVQVNLLNLNMKEILRCVRVWGSHGTVYVGQIKG